MEDTILTNARLVLPDRVLDGHLLIRNGVIADIADGPGPAGGQDMGGDWLAPGLIELHTDNLERHIRPRPAVDWPHDAAILAHDAELASTGITTVFDALRVGSIPWRPGYGAYARPLASEILALRAAGVLRISHFLHLRAEICSETLIEELAQFGADDRVRLVSLMDHTPGQRQFRDEAKFAQYITGTPDVTDPRYSDYADKLKALSSRVSDGHQAAAVAFAHRTGAVLASHDDTDLDHVTASAAHGVRLAEFPTTIAAAQACRDHGIAIIMGAPNLIRGGSHSGNVGAEALARDDLLDIVSSDYVPAALLASALQLGALWGDLPRAIACVTASPADATGLTDRGRIAPGLRADLIRFGTAPGGAPVLRGTWVAGRRVA